MSSLRKTCASLGLLAALTVGIPNAIDALAQVGAGASGGGQPVTQGGGGAPILSACGTTPSFLGIATNLSGRIQTGGGATTSCTLTWTNAQGVAAPRITPPSCEVTAEQVATTLVTAVPSINSLILTYTSTTAGVLDYHCDGV